jgi:3-deoxy-D-manno-octulosonate 8-phosphate phosphatase (KDO 8-P phosphatase)
MFHSPLGQAGCFNLGRAEISAQHIKGVIFDVDGVFTDNRELIGYVGDQRVMFKSRSYYDGQGVSLLRAIGIKVMLVTNEKFDPDQKQFSAAMIYGLVQKWNKLPSSKSDVKPDGWEHVTLFTGMGGDKKVVAVEQWFTDNPELNWDNCAGMGNDLVDYAFLKKVVFRIAPAQANIAIRRIAHFVTAHTGGDGAVRDFADFVLKSRNIDPLELPPQ